MLASYRWTEYHRRLKMGVSSLHDAIIKYSSITITVTWKVLVKQFLLLLPRPVTKDESKLA